MGQSIESLLDTLEEGSWSEDKGSRVIYGDNQSAQSIVTNPDGPWRTRHLRLRSFVLREQVSAGAWKIRHVSGSKLVADYLTKSVTSKVQWEAFYAMCGMRIYTQPEESDSGARECLTKLVGLAVGLGGVARMTSGPAKTVGLAAMTLGLIHTLTDLRRRKLDHQPPLGTTGRRIQEPRAKESGQELRAKETDQEPRAKDVIVKSLGAMQKM